MNDGGMTYREISEALGISISQVRLIEKQALEKLRQNGGLEILMEYLEEETSNYPERVFPRHLWPEINSESDLLGGGQ